MSKLCLIIENLDEDDDGQVKTCFKTFCLKVENDDWEFCYQGIKLSKYELTITWAKTVYRTLVQYQTFALKLNKDFLRLWILLHFQTLLLLDNKSWPKDDFVSFGNREINKLTEHYMALQKWM